MTDSEQPKRICLVPDVPNWAWHRRAEGIRRNAPQEFHVDTLCWQDWSPSLLEDYDATLQFSWTDAKRIRNCWVLVANEGCQYEYDPESSFLPQRTASRNKNATAARDYLKRFKGVICINRGCLDFVTQCNPRTVYLRTGVDTDVFTPGKTRKPPQLTVGWCGKPSTETKFSPKGYQEVLLPVMRNFAGLGGIDFRINDRDSTCAMTTVEMIEWYRSIDVLLVTSCSEGTPSVLLEAMACGVPYISTGVGIVPEVEDAVFDKFGISHGCGFNVQNYHSPKTAEMVVANITEMLHWSIRNREQLSLMGDASRQLVESEFSWRSLSRIWCETLTSERS